MMWTEGESRPDTHAAFRGRFTAESSPIKIRVFSSVPFLLYLDGVWIAEGPVRWAKSAPEYQLFEIAVTKGEHLIAIHAHYEGVDTRMMEAQAPFIDCQIDSTSIQWKAQPLTAFTPQVKRINPQFGWIDWCDTRSLPHNWNQPNFDDQNWPTAKPTTTTLPEPKPTEIHLPVARPHALKATKQGLLTEGFGYDADEPAAQFFLRDLEAKHGPPQGVWKRYDLGRVRLGRPNLTIEAPAGAVVEFAYSEDLAHNRVVPWITLSAGPSCNLDRFIAAGGPQTFTTTTPKAGRYMEVHIIANPKQIHFLKEEFNERSYHGDKIGAFQSADERLNQIWKTGIETYRACSEDSVIDNPTRERGEWIGDSLTVGLENAAVAFSDLKLFKKALRQAAACARPDGLVAGLCPGTVTYLSTYACHWVNAGLRMFELTGDKELLQELHPAAERNMQVFKDKLTHNGLQGDMGWAFIDWGYVGNEGPSDMGLNLIYRRALRSMIRWCELLQKDPDIYKKSLIKLDTAIKTYLSQEFQKPDPWKSIGLQRLVLTLRENLIEKPHLPEAIASIKSHYTSCFPNDPFAPHLADPSAAQPRLITPFFSHFALPILWENNEAEFVLHQYRSCWGWALDQGLTTWPEVFDLRWSHCHQWSACPTWQLSRHVLGLSPRQDLGKNVFDFHPVPTTLHSVKGRIPIPASDDYIDVEVKQALLTIDSSTPIRLNEGQKLSEPSRSFTRAI